MKKKVFISAVIAAYNEKGNVERLFVKISEVLQKINADYEIIGIIDGNDGAFEALESIKNENNQAEWRLYHNEKPLGLGVAYRKGFKHVSEKADFVLTMDADWNHDPEEITCLLAKMDEGRSDIVVGSRLVKGGTIIGMPLWKRILSTIMNKVFSLLTNLKTKDKTSGYRLYRKSALDLIKDKYQSKNFEFMPEMLILAEKQNLKISETPIRFTFRTVGKSKMGKVQTMKGYLRLMNRTIMRQI